MKKENLKKNLFTLIKEGTCAFTCIKYLKKILLQNNFLELEEIDTWDLKNGNYFVIRNDASLVAFRVTKNAKSFHIITTHSDTPSLLLKPNGENKKNHFLKYNIMPYGGLLHYGWLDHLLTLSGRIITKKEQIITKKVVHFKNISSIIPSVAIHQNDTANTNLNLNPQIDLQPIFGLEKETTSLKTLLEKELKLEKNEELLDYDLFLSNKEEPNFIGEKKELLASPRIDNLTSVSAALESFLEEKNTNHINVFCTFNNEEIGSLTKEGADSNFLLDTLKKIASNLNLDISSTLSKSFIISSDNTHGVHPNHEEYKDDTASAYLGNGFAIVKETESTTDAYFSSILKLICDKEKIKYQDATAKNDLTGGSTLSGLSLRHVSVTSIDVGLPQLAMHSSIEVCSIKDYYELYKMMKAFYHSNIEIKKESTKIF